MIGAYKINDIDLFSAYGIVVESGSDSLLQYPVRKQPYVYDWGGEDGIEIDLSLPVFQARDFTFNCALIADSEVDFWGKYKAFFALLSSNGSMELYSNELDAVFDVYYKSMNGFERFTRIKNTGQVAMKFTITLGEISPEIGGKDIYIWSQDGFNVVSQNGENIVTI